MNIEQKNSIAVIGGCGFVGTNLSTLFQKKDISHHIYDIKVKSNDSSSSYMDVEQNNLSEILLNETNVIINLAAVHRDDIKPITKYDDVNVKGAINVCNAARENNINSIIFTSSVAIYGFAPPNTDESGEPSYFNDYGRTKYEAENIYKNWQKEKPHERTLIIIRPTVIFGEGNRGNVFNLLNQIASRKFIMFGNGKNIKSMAYVKNVVSFINFCIPLTSGIKVYNYIDKPDFDMNSLVSLVRSILFMKRDVGIRLPAFLGIFIGYVADLISSITRIKLPISAIRVKKFMGTTQFKSSIDELNFKAPYTLEQGMINTLDYEFVNNNKDKKTFETE